MQPVPYPYIDDLSDEELYVLSTLGKGPKGEKGDSGDPTQEQVKAALEAIVEEHPEYVTTVEDHSISTIKLADNSVTHNKMADRSVGTNELIDGSVTTPKIANGAVTTSKLADGSVTYGKVDITTFPSMGTGTRGIAKVGAGLAMNGDALELDGSGDIATAVQSWLDAHPEATTTVEDGSITDDKLVQSGGIRDTVNEIIGKLPSKTETIIRASGTDGLTWEMGKYYYSVEESGSSLIQADYAQLACAIYGPVHRGDVFHVTAESIGNGYAIYIVDDDNMVIERYRSPQGTAYYDYTEYVVPSDGTMYLNTAITAYLDGAMRYRLTQDVVRLIKSSLDGVKWTSIGDSLNEFNSTAETNWIRCMIAATDADNTNLAVSGTGFYRGAPLEEYATNNYISKIGSIPSDVELITVAGSFNDLMSGPWPTLPVGTSSDTGTETIAGYMNDFFDELLSQFPTVPIAVVMTSPWDAFKPGVQRSDDYVSVLGEICRKNGIPFCPDCYYGCNLKPWVQSNRVEYYTHPNNSVDGVHPNSKGHMFIYRMLRPFLEKCAHTEY